MRLNLVPFVVLAVFSGFGPLCAGVKPFRADTPVTPNASPEARSLLAYLSEIYGQKTLSGQQEGRRSSNGLSFELNHIQETTGKLPAILGLDVIDVTNPNRAGRTNGHPVARRAQEWSARNGIVTICWHWYAPAGTRAFYSKDTSYNFTSALTPGSPGHDALIRDIDAVSEELKVLRDAGVPVLWRPLHEANGRWFWWGMQGPAAFRDLWRLMFERMTGTHQLTNLLWVFSPGASMDLADWYPGDALVDIIGQDHYPMDGNDGPAKDVFDELAALGRGTKLVGMSENGPIPEPGGMFAEKAPWLFYITWSGTMLTGKNTREQLRHAFNHPAVINLGDLPADWKRRPHPVPSKATELAFVAPPGASAIGGTPRLPVTIAVQDRNGRTVREVDFTVAVEAKGRSGKSARFTARTINGVATFENLQLREEGIARLEASAKGLKSARSATFQVGPGNGMAREWWTNNAVTRLEDVAAASGPPNGRETLARCFEVPFQPATNYTARYRGWLLPEAGGEHRFRIAASGEVEFWLSRDSEPANRVRVVRIGAETPYAKWPHTNEAESAPLKLETGKRYYVEVLHRQPAGSAHLSVRWLGPTQPTPRLIGADRLEAFAPAENNDAERASAR